MMTISELEVMHDDAQDRLRQARAAGDEQTAAHVLAELQEIECGLDDLYMASEMEEEF
jgi:hypothetical protein